MGSREEKVRLHKQSVSRRPPTTFLKDSSSAGGYTNDNEILLYEMGQAIGLLTAPIDIENLGYKIAAKVWDKTHAWVGTISTSGGIPIELPNKLNISYAKIYVTTNPSLLSSDPDAATFLTLLYFGTRYVYNGYQGTMTLMVTNYGSNGGLSIAASNFKYNSTGYGLYVGAVFYA